MRTAAVALPYLDDEDAVADAARKLSALTHYDPRAQEACVLWSLAIRRAIVDEEIDLRSGLAHLPADSAKFWTDHIDEAQTSDPARFTPNGWWCRRCRQRGRRSPTRPNSTTTRPDSSATDWSPRSLSAMTPTPLPPSPVHFWAPAGVRPRSPSTGVRFSTATRACVPTISCNSAHLAVTGASRSV